MGSICPADLTYGTAAVLLRHRLPGRSLVDGTTGRPIPYFDGRKLSRFTYLPCGYRFSDYFPAAFAGWDRKFSSADQENAVVQIEQVAGNRPDLPSWSAESRATVDGRPATVVVNSENSQVLHRA